MRCSHCGAHIPRTSTVTTASYETPLEELVYGPLRKRIAEEGMFQRDCSTGFLERATRLVSRGKDG